jgi:hypothetical protein
VLLAALAVRVKERLSGGQAALENSVCLFKPETVIGWHRALVLTELLIRSDFPPEAI